MANENMNIIGAGQGTARPAPKTIKNNSYYWVNPVYEFNLPSGVSCPFSKSCTVYVSETTGKFLNGSTDFRCYAAPSERFPAVRTSRWNNYRAVLNGVLPDVSMCKHVRIHASGDFFSQQYFDLWLAVCSSHAKTLFWAFTKSVNFWVNRINDIPKNMVLTASVGGHYDYLISRYNLKCARVIMNKSDAGGLPIDTNDYYAANNFGSFCLLDNNIRRTSCVKCEDSPAQDTKEICHTAPNTAMAKCQQVELGL